MIFSLCLCIMALLINFIIQEDEHRKLLPPLAGGRPIHVLVSLNDVDQAVDGKLPTSTSVCMDVHAFFVASRRMLTRKSVKNMQPSGNYTTSTHQRRLCESMEVVLALDSFVDIRLAYKHNITRLIMQQTPFLMNLKARHPPCDAEE